MEHRGGEAQELWQDKNPPGMAVQGLHGSVGAFWAAGRAQHCVPPSTHLGTWRECSSAAWYEVLIPPCRGMGPLPHPASSHICFFLPAIFVAGAVGTGPHPHFGRAGTSLLPGHLEVLSGGWGCSQPAVGAGRAWLRGSAPLLAETGVPGSCVVPASLPTGPHSWANAAHTQTAF